MEVIIPAQVFFENVDKLRNCWKKEFEKDFDGIILINGKTSAQNQKTVSIVTWLFAAFNITETIIALTQNHFIVYGSERKINFLASLQKHPKHSQKGLNLFQKTENVKEDFEKIWKTIFKGTKTPKIGLLKEKKLGNIAEQFSNFLEQKTHEPVEVTKFFGECLLSKNDREVGCIKKSSLVSCYFFQKFIKQIEDCIDLGKKIKHVDLVNKIVEVMNSELQTKKCMLKVNGGNPYNMTISKDFIDYVPHICLQSGGKYSQKIFTEANNEYLKSDCIIASLGSQYQGYSTYIGRTLFINPNILQKQTYKKAVGLSKILQQNLRPGIALNQVYQKAIEFMNINLKDVQKPKSFGFGMGVFLNQQPLNICEKNKRVIEKGFSFLVNVTLVGLKYSTKAGEKQYMIQILQTVIVQQTGQEVLTAKVNTALSNISYELELDDPENKGSERKQSDSFTPDYQCGVMTRRGKKKEQTVAKFKNQKKRNEHQIQLKKRKYAQLRERVGEEFLGDQKNSKSLECWKIQTYKAKESLPKNAKKNQIYLDQKHLSVLLPINSKHVPFNLNLVKSVVRNNEGKYASLRFNFHNPATAKGSNLIFPKFTEPTFYLKEILFRNQNQSRFIELQKSIKALQKKMKTDFSERRAKQEIVEQQALQLNRGKRPILRDLFARPVIGAKKQKGSLECHLNGFRYVTARGDSIQIIFSNIKFAFFQPCEKEIIAAIHFRLNSGIMIGKKKSNDIQFYSEGGSVTEQVDMRRARDDSDDEQRQKQTRRKIDKEFKIWIKSCDEFKGRNFVFQMPNRSGSFYGNHFKQNSLLQPTNSCLINITEMPFFVCPLEDIEIVCFERVYANSKTFDIIIVMRDYENHVKINAIPIKDCEKVKDWLDSCDIIFYEQGRTLNWTKFMVTIRRDFKKFVDDGGWMAWDEVDEEEEDKFVQDDESFQISGSEFESESDQSSSESNYDQQSSEYSEESLSDQGESSDQMDKRAQMEDQYNKIRQRPKNQPQNPQKKGKQRSKVPLPQKRK